MKSKVSFLVVFLILVSAVSALSADEAKFARFPSPSPDGSKIAFSYHGDIWVVSAQGGRALRLTVHEAYDHRPVWSPDGKMIAFSSDRYGNDDVFVMSAEGGDAKRLTYLSMPDLVTDWTNDGKEIMFTSNRDYSSSGATRVPYLLTVPITGGEPKMYMPEAGNEGTFSPDGKLLAYADHSRRDWVRIGYRGKANNDIYTYDKAADKFERITDFLGSDSCPMWNADGSSLYYLSEESGNYNVHKFDFASKAKSQVTKHDDSIRFPKIARNGSIIAYELGMDIYTMDVATGASKKVEIIAPSEARHNAVERKTIRSGASEYQVSDDGSEIAFVVRGEIYVMKEEGGKAHRLTNNPARDMNITWKKDGSAIIFSSDRDGDYDLYMVESDDPDTKKLSKALSYKVTRITDNNVRETGADMSPDGKTLAYITNDTNLHLYNMETKEDKVLLDGWNLSGFSWSPDSRWMAFAREDNEFNTEIYIISVEGGKAVNISKHPDNEFGPVWSADGKKLAFVSRRYDNNYDLWYLWLTKADHEKTKEDWEEEEEAKKAAKKAPKKNGDNKAEKGKNGKDDAKEEKEPEFQVKIDFDKINTRLQRVISMAGSEYEAAISPDGKTFALTSNTEGQSDLYTVKWDGTELKKITRGGAFPGNLRFDKAGKKIYFLSRGAIKSAALSGKVTSHGFEARTSIDYPGERMQKYEEAWRTLARLFYDENYHGADFKAVREKYRPFAQTAATERDFGDVVNMVFGHLNGSHLGYRGSFGGGPRDNTGILGLEFDPEYTGEGMKIAKVMPNGPTDKEALRLKPGQILKSIDGTPVSWKQNMAQLLNDTVGKKVVIMVADDEKAEAKRHIVRPISARAYMGLMYERFVEKTRKRTHELSNGRIGYLHIQAMGKSSLERFEMELYSEAHDKDAIVIDVRNNGGGSTTDMILAMLQVKDHAWTQARGSDVKGYPQDRRPLYAWTKPIIVLCNEYSYSNAEIFSWSIKTLGRGKVYGQQTFGAVISTGGYTLIDGSYVRTPFRGWYVYGSNINQELNGCPPDKVIEYQPGESAKGIDTQLDTAVKDLLAELK